MNKTYKTICKMIEKSLHPDHVVEVEKLSREEWQEVYDEMLKQAIIAMPLDILDEFNIDPVVKEQFEVSAGRSITNWYNLMVTQQEVVDLFEAHQIPYVILKGAAAAMNYPEPTYRMMGDIDILVEPEKFEKASTLLVENGFYHEESDNKRHDGFIKGKVEVELHHFFGKTKENLLSVVTLEALDKSAVHSLEGFNFSTLPSLVNGIVLLAHIRHHLPKALGLRHILDWMVYVEKNLDDPSWETNFFSMAKKLDMERLAVTVAKMCQLYLGLDSELDWCYRADDVVVDELMNYSIERGNFDNKLGDKRKVVEVLTFIRRGEAFKQLQWRGEKNWKLLVTHPRLRPFAWLYQICRYIRYGLTRKNPFMSVRSSFKSVTKQERLLKEFGVK